MSAAYTPVPGNDGGPRGMVNGMRLRIRPLQMLLLFGVGLIIVVPLLAGSDRRAQMHSYISTTRLGKGAGHRHSPELSSHIAPPSGGIPDEEDVPLTLEARLKYLLERPALEQFEAELPNRHACPMFTYARNTYFFHEGKDEHWKAITANDVRQYRRRMVDYFRDLDDDGKTKLVWDKSMEANTPADQRRGIIYTGGEGKTLARLRFSLIMLRKVIKSTLPVEIYYYAGEMTDQKIRDEFTTEYGVTLVESSIPKVHGKLWRIKNRAFLDTKFTQFVYMDSDNIPLSDPADLFESIEFKRSGSVFWPDLNKDHPDNAIWRILGRTCSDEHWPGESGQVIFDKSANDGLNLAVIHLSNHMMDNYEKQYEYLTYGDKDTYRFSFYALGLPYQQPSRMFASAGGFQWSNSLDSKDMCGHALLQWGLTPTSARYDSSFRPPPAFLHTILTKHRHGLQPAKLFSHYKRPREDGINDPRLIRTLYEYTGDCFDITLKGPDGLPDSPNSYFDGQGELVEPMSELLPPHVWKALFDMSVDIAGLNVPGE